MFLLFYRQNDLATNQMAQALKDGLARRGGVASSTMVRITNAAEKPIVDRFDVSRAPMPLTVAVAPNGAITGVFQKLTDPNIESAIVTPTMTRCMKALQDNKLVFVCVQTGNRDVVPAAVQGFQTDPQFQSRTHVVSMRLQDPAEGKFLDQMQIDPRQTTAPLAVLLAPPGVLIGKYDARATKEQVAAAVHKAGKCCDDPNCKHNQAATTPAAAPSAARTPANSGRRN